MPHSTREREKTVIGNRAGSNKQLEHVRRHPIERAGENAALEELKKSHSCLPGIVLTTCWSVGDGESRKRPNCCADNKLALACISRKAIVRAGMNDVGCGYAITLYSSVGSVVVRPMRTGIRPCQEQVSSAKT